MNRLTQRLVLVLAILAVSVLAIGCGAASSIKNAASSIAASHSVTISPPTLSPPTSAAPTTAPPTTAPATSAPAPSSQAPPTPSPTTTAAAASSISSYLPWIILGAVVLIIIIILIARASGRRSAAVAGQRSREVDVYAKGSALYDSMSIAEAPGALAAPDAAARWADIERRADDLNQELYALRETARGEAERGRVDDVITTLQQARAAMAAERAPGAMPESARVHGLLRNFDIALRTLRDPSGQRL